MATRATRTRLGRKIDRAVAESNPQSLTTSKVSATEARYSAPRFSDGARKAALQGIALQWSADRIDEDEAFTRAFMVDPVTGVSELVAAARPVLTPVKVEVLNDMWLASDDAETDAMADEAARRLAAGQRIDEAGRLVGTSGSVQPTRQLNLPSGVSSAELEPRRFDAPKAQPKATSKRKALTADGKRYAEILRRFAKGKIGPKEAFVRALALDPKNGVRKLLALSGAAKRGDAPILVSPMAHDRLVAADNELSDAELEELRRAADRRRKVNEASKPRAKKTTKKKSAKKKAAKKKPVQLRRFTMKRVPKGLTDAQIRQGLREWPVVKANPSRSLAVHSSAYEGASPREVQQIATGKKRGKGSSRPFEPVQIVVQPGSASGFDDVVIVDGNHRIAAAKKAGAEFVHATVRVDRDGQRGTPVPAKLRIAAPKKATKKKAKRKAASKPAKPKTTKRKPSTTRAKSKNTRKRTPKRPGAYKRNFAGCRVCFGCVV